MEPAQELLNLIEEQLKTVCPTQLPRLCEFVKSDEGKETAQRMIFEYCTEHGVSVQSAMAHIDTEL